jgi:hypothetical protein
VRSIFHCRSYMLKSHARNDLPDLLPDPSLGSRAETWGLDYFALQTRQAGWRRAPILGFSYNDSTTDQYGRHDER